MGQIKVTLRFRGGGPLDGDSVTHTIPDAWKLVQWDHRRASELAVQHRYCGYRHAGQQEIELQYQGTQQEAPADE